MTAKDRIPESRIHIEPREASSLDFYAAQHLPAGEIPDPTYPGPIDQITATEPHCAAYRKHMARVRTDACNGMAEAKQEPRKAPKVPRDSEPMHLIEAVGIVGGAVTLFCLAAGAFGWSLKVVAGWIGGVL